MSGFYASHLKSRQARQFAGIIEQHLLSSDLPSKTIQLGKSSHMDNLEQDVSVALYAVKADHPEVFYVGNTSSLITHFTGTVSVELSYKYSDQEIRSYRAMLDKRLNRKVTQIRTSTRGIFERELGVYRDLCQSVSYVDDGNPIRHDIVGALIEEKAVCEGISKAFACMAHRLGIHAIVVTGKGRNERHAWNMVSVNGITAHVDVTWGITDLGPDYSYFNLTDEQIFRDHTADLSILPKCRYSQGSYYHLRSTHAVDEKHLISIIRTKIQQGETDIQVRLEEGDIQYAVSRALLLTPRATSSHCIPTQNTALIHVR